MLKNKDNEPAEAQTKVQSYRIMAGRNLLSKDESVGLTSERFYKLAKSQAMEKLGERIASCEDKNQRQELKKQLPYMLPHVHAIKGSRKNENVTEESQLALCDIDGLTDPRGFYEKEIKRYEEELGIIAANISISQKGLHLLVERRGRSIEATQQWISEQLEGIEIDPACKDIARAEYFVPWKNYLYFNEEAFFTMPEKQENVEEEVETLTHDKDDSCRVVSSLSYEGTSYEKIVEELIEVMGGEPSEGTRNNFIYRLSRCLSGICNNNAEVLRQIIPHFGLTEKEVNQIIKSATKEPVKVLWAEMKQTLANLGLSQKEWWRTDEDLIYLYQRDVMRNLPYGLKEVILKAPENKRMNVLCAVLPVLATYAENVKFHHATGETGHMALMTAIIGPFGKGKSSLCNKACDLYLKTINEQDEEGWKTIQNFNEKLQTRSANENAGQKPHPIIRNIASVATCPYIVDRLNNSQGHMLVCVTSEVQDLLSDERENANRSKMLRKAFDEEEHAVGRVGENSISAKTTVRLNTTVMGTFNAVTQFFGSGNIENGLSSRFIISFLPHEVGQQWLQYKPYDEETEKAALELTQQLTNYEGELKTPRLDKAIKRWWEEKNQLVIEHNDAVLGSLINRMAVIGHRCGVLFHMMTGNKKETPTTVKFALLMAEYCLREQIRFFGKTLEILSKEQNQLKVPPQSTNIRLLEKLPETFTFDDAKALKPGVKDDSITRMLQRLTAEKVIEKIGTRQYHKR